MDTPEGGATHANETYGGRPYEVVVYNDEHGWSVVRLEDANGAVPGARIDIRAPSATGTKREPIRDGVTDGCIRDLVRRLHAGEFSRQ